MHMYPPGLCLIKTDMTYWGFQAITNVKLNHMVGMMIFGRREMHFGI